MTIIITAKRDGFRRCGIAHSTHGTAYPDDFFTAVQLAQLKREPQLVVVEGAELDQEQAGGNESDSTIGAPASEATAPPGAAPDEAVSAATAKAAVAVAQLVEASESFNSACKAVQDAAIRDPGKAKSARSLKAKEETPPETAPTAAPEGEQAGAQAVVGSETEVAPSEGNGE